MKYFHNILLGLLFVTLITSCKDDDLGSELKLANEDNKTAVFNDSSMVVNAYTYQQYDSIFLNPQSLLLGYNVDDKIGEFQNNFMTEVAPSSYGISFGENPIADSMVLYLDYTYAYGDTSQLQTITVYELNKGISLNDPFDGIHAKPMEESIISKFYDKTNPLTTFSFKPHPKDTLPIRVVLPANFIARFLDTVNYATLDSFQTNVFRGFYFVAEPISTGGAISYFNVSDSTGMQLYYHNDKDTLTYKYIIDAYTYRCNIFKRKYNNQINIFPAGVQPDENLMQDLFYIKFNNALEGRVEITNLQNWADSGFFTLNSAVLNIYVEQPKTSIDSLYHYIPSITALQLNSNQQLVYLTEYMADKAYLKVNYDTLPNGYGYRIDIRKTLYNAIQNGDDKLSLVLKPDKEINRSHANRIILKGTKNTEQPIKLKITYIRLN